MNDLKKYTNKRHIDFVKKMKKAGRGDKLMHYRGRFYYEGPAVTCEKYEVEDVKKAAGNMRLLQDSLGLGSIVYPG